MEEPLAAEIGDITLTLKGLLDMTMAVDFGDDGDDGNAGAVRIVDTRETRGILSLRYAF